MIHTVTGILVLPMDTVSFDDPMTGETRQLEWSEVSQMLVDEFAINERSRRLGYNEMTRGWDKDDYFYVRKDKFKSAWYQPWMAHLIKHLHGRGW
eukprot:227140-Rhodomonas_salina.1